MTDFAGQIQSFTCIGEDSKKKIVAACGGLTEEKQAEILATLREGEAKKVALQDDHDSKMLGLLDDYLGKITEFKRGPLREGVKKAEVADHGHDEDEAEKLLKQL